MDSETSSEDEESEYDSSDSSPDTNHTKLTRHMTKVRRMRIKRRVRKGFEKPRLQVDIVIKEQKVNAIADTGFEICVTFLRQAQELGLPLSKTKMKIHPYGSKSMKCCG